MIKSSRIKNQLNFLLIVIVYKNEYYLIVIIINSLWRDESCFTLVDSMYRMYNVFLNPSNGKSLQVLAGHDVRIGFALIDE